MRCGPSPPCERSHAIMHGPAVVTRLKILCPRAPRRRSIDDIRRATAKLYTAPRVRRRSAGREPLAACGARCCLPTLCCSPFPPLPRPLPRFQLSNRASVQGHEGGQGSASPTRLSKDQGDQVLKAACLQRVVTARCSNGGEQSRHGAGIVGLSSAIVGIINLRRPR